VANTPFFPIVSAMPQCEYNVVNSKGKFIFSGLLSIVELLPSNLIIKSLWLGSLKDDSLIEIANKFEIYNHLGLHRRLVPVKGYTTEGELLLQYMLHSNLADYLHTHSKTISISQRLQ
jgi:hypothetical protein